MLVTRLIWFMAAVLGVLASVCQAVTEPRLNVLLITADDLGLQLGSYGETLIETPSFDALAASSVQFDISYAAQASCSSSRSALFTGLFPHSTGQYGLANGGFSLLPELRDRTLPNLLKGAGYWTGIIGKLHVAPEESFKFDRRERVGRNVARIAQLAGQFMDEAGRAPFFLMVNYVDPHAFGDAAEPTRFPPQVEGVPENPISPGPETLFPFQQIDTPEQRARTAGFYNAVLRLDAGIGLLMDELDRRGHRDDTLVIFISDQVPGFTRSKTTVYEPGIRIPFMVRWPGVSKSMRSDSLVSTVDVLPTILDALGVEAMKVVHPRQGCEVGVAHPTNPEPRPRMNIHKHARMTVHGRALLVQRVTVEGWSVADAARAAGVSVRTAYKWLARHRAGGAAALHDRKPTPGRCPHRLGEETVAEIKRLRWQRLSGPAIARQLGLARSTVGAVLRRLGLGRLATLDPKPPAIRYERQRPGELIHIDTKKLGRIAGVGHRITGHHVGMNRSRGIGWEHLHVAVGLSGILCVRP